MWSQFPRIVVIGVAFLVLSACGGGGDQHPNRPPIASLTVSPTAGVTPLTVTLNGSGSVDPDGRVVTYAWDCGDGSAAESGVAASHVFLRPGAFTVTLTVTDDKGANSSASQRVTVENRPPVVSFAPYFESGFVAAVMRFDASPSADPDGRIVSYSWDLGDGSTADGMVANHRYAAAGEYVVKLTVHDDVGASASMQSTVLVRPEGEFPAYQMLDLGTLGGAKSDGRDINAAGQVTGHAQTADGRDHAFIAAAGQPMLDLHALPDTWGSDGKAINDAGQVTGTAGDHAFLAGPGQPMVDLGTLPGDSCSSGNGVNASGQVAGVSGVWNPSFHSCSAPAHTLLVSAGQPGIDLLGGRYGLADAINDAGQVAGSAVLGDGQMNHAFVAAAGQSFVDLGTLGGAYSYAFDINNSGQVTGTSQLADGSEHAFVAAAGQPMIDLGTLGGRTSEGIAINDRGQVTGWAQPAAGLYRAFVVTAGQPMVDLGTLGGRHSSSSDINSTGHVTGISETADGSLHAFVAAAGEPMIDLGTLGSAPFSWGRAINNSGQVTGLSGASELDGHAFLATPISLQFSRLVDSTAAVPAASRAGLILASAQAGYLDRDLPTSCERLGQYDSAVTELIPGQMSQVDADELLQQSAAIADELRCP